MLPVAYFFSVPTTAPERWAWFRAPLPRMTVSRCEAPPRVLLPILVTVSQSSAMVSRVSMVGRDVALRDLMKSTEI